MRVAVGGIGIAAPGLPDWTTLLSALGGQDLDAELQPRASSLLSARERRRCPETVRLSFSAAEQACDMAGTSPSEIEAVFCSGMGDIQITDYMCRTLAESPELLSPTRFHNSVHNAAAGYWSIGAGVRLDVTAVSGWRDSVQAGLLEAVSRVNAGNRPVLLVVYDSSSVGPMQDLWTARRPFSSALLLAPETTPNALACLELTLHRSAEDDRGPSLPPSLAEIVVDNPAARMLRLLALLAPGVGYAEVELCAVQGPGLRIRRTG